MIEWPFVGRQGELRDLDDWFGQSAVGGVTIFGAAGSGKSWLAAQCLARSRVERPTVRCGRAVAEVPLACLGSLLRPEQRTGSIATLLATVERHLRELGRRQDVVLLVEDAQWLDPASAHLLRRLVSDGALRVLLTVRTSEPITAALADLVKENRMRSLELAPLELDDLVDLLEKALAGPVDGDLVGTVFALSEGNPLFVRELVTASLTAKAIRLDESWTLAGPLEVSTLLTDLIGNRIRALSDGAQDALRCLAEARTLELEHLLALATPEAVAELERAGLVESYDAERTGRYRPAHALFEEVVLADTPLVERRAICGRLAEALEDLGDRGDAATLEIVRWRLGSLTAPSSVELERAVALALRAHDYTLAAECGRLLWRRDPTPHTALALGDALFAMHTHNSLVELEDLLARCQGTMSPTDPRLVGLVSLRALNLGVGIGKIGAAMSLLQGISRETEQADADRLGIALGATYLYSGQPDQALAALATVDRTAVPTGELHWSNALWMAGRLEDLRAHLAGVPADSHEAWMVSSEASALLFLGELDAATVKARECLASLYVATADDVFAPLAANLVLGWAAMMRGRSAASLPHFQAAVDAVPGVGLSIVPLGYLAMAAAHAGDVRLARQSMATIATIASTRHDGATRRDSSSDPLTLYAVALGRAATSLAEGRSPAEAAAMLRSAALKLAPQGQRLNEAWLLHEAVCLRQARRSDAERLATLAAEIGGALTPLWAEHAAAIVSTDIDALGDVAQRLAELGDVRDAVHAAWSAWLFAVDDHRNRVANVALARLRALVARTDWQPSFRPAPVELHGLTSRELQVTRRAALGLSSKEIADELSLSTRTVDNNLQRVYAKLGVTGRRDLRDLPGLADDCDP
ncbi:MAG: HTH-type transcriptional regulator malT [Acidimicrobiales bacterium]|nr:HTH-type transcriptional regulator malT [Acidimicrobiales bacterium]